MSYEKAIDDLIEDGENDTARALALIACGIFDVARAIRLLGNANASTSMGAIENLALQVKEAGESMTAALDGIASSR